MKKTYKKVAAFVALFSLLVFNAGAQLNGVYTINAFATTGGNNFQSFTALATALNTQGVSGPVTVNVLAASGPYVEQVQFGNITGVSATNNITINGNGNLITFNSNSSTQAWTINLNGADRMVFNNLQVQGTGANYAYPLMMNGGADFNKFTACTFSVNANQGTGTGQMPVVISGANNTYANAATSGNNNTWDGCDIFGGYYAMSFYGPTTQGLYCTNNRVLNSTIRDFYYMGIYMYYQDRATVRGNIVDRLTRTSFQSICYGIQVVVTTGTIVEENIVHHLFQNGQTNTASTYGIYIQGNTIANAGEGSHIRNNIVKDINSNSLIYGIMAYYTKGGVEHNTVSLDFAGCTSGSQAFGLYMVTTTGLGVTAMNNLISITRGGAGQKVGIYYASTSLITSNKNDIWVNSPGGNNFAGYFGGNMATLANLQSASGQEAQSYSINPVYTNLTTGDLHPTAATLNNLAAPIGIAFDQTKAVRNQLTPDIGALEFLTPLCTGAPASNTVVAPTFSICPGESVALGLAFWPSDAGITYAWQTSSVSSVGPFNPVGAGGNGLFYTAPTVTANTWFNVVITCTAPGGFSTSAVAPVMIAGPSSSVVPAYEDFEGIGLPDRLPNCSWAASSQGGANKTYTTSNSGNRVPRSGTSFATFDVASPGTSYYYTNPIAMNSNITYSAALWYATEYLGYNNWTNLSIWVGPNQNPTGMVQVASVSPAISGPYKLLNGLFTVPTAGNYYVAIRATSSSGSALYLSWDDLSITIPCHPGGPNTPTVSLTAGSNTVCSGDLVSLNAAGADTYSWSTGDQIPAITVQPENKNGTPITIEYTVWGTNALTGCALPVTTQIVVNPIPDLFTMADANNICSGDQVSISAFGATSYVWQPTSATGQVITVSPASTTQYVVSGTNVYGCSSTYTQQITVKPTPTIALQSSNQDACKDDLLTLTAFGGVSYMWISDTSPNVWQGPIINIQASAPTVFTVTGVGANGCTQKVQLIQNISGCVGIAKNSADISGIKIYPNPTSGEFSVELNNNALKTVEVLDVTGRVIVSSTTVNEVVNVNINELAGGVYYVKVQSNEATAVVKVIKQ